MDNKERIKQLEKFIREEPHDPFNLYALALEYLHIDKNLSIKLFEDLLNNHPEYVSTYYHAAALYDTLGQIDRAEEVYIKGIEMAKKVDDKHTLKELESAYLNFRFENN